MLQRTELEFRNRTAFTVQRHGIDTVSIHVSFESASTASTQAAVRGVAGFLAMLQQHLRAACGTAGVQISRGMLDPGLAASWAIVSREDRQ